MKNVQKDTQKTLEVLESEKEKSETSTPVVGTDGQAQPRMTPRQEHENTLNYLNATYSLLEHGLFIGKDSNILIQVKAWIENQQKAISLQIARIMTAEADSKGGK